MVKLLTERGYDFLSLVEKDIMRDIKERLFYVVLDYEEEMGKAAESNENEQRYELPDVNVITIGSMRFSYPEMLFKPHLMGWSMTGSARQCTTRL